MSLAKWETWATILEHFRQWMLIPVATLAFGYATLYLDKHYVSREYFDKAMITLAEDKDKYATEQRLFLREISVKLDTLIETRAVNTQRISDNERRLARLEDKADRAH